MPQKTASALKAAKKRKQFIKDVVLLCLFVAFDAKLWARGVGFAQKVFSEPVRAADE